MRNFSLPLPVVPVRVPVISLPVITTLTTCLSSTCFMKRENEIWFSLLCSEFEKFQIRTPTTTRTIQNSKLLRVEFNLGLLTALLSRVTRLPKAP